MRKNNEQSHKRINKHINEEINYSLFISLQFVDHWSQRNNALEMITKTEMNII